ncbi:NUDIX hydrolase [Rhizobium sp. HT1-10]|uniref:NUDIX hydrolase n=1 Tax=Rhizobium sp. HT1-10 TaxID=3111638 RepID=UPI003C222F18
MPKKEPRTFLRKLADEAGTLFQGRNIEQYAAICYRRMPGTGEIEVLLISTRGSGRWVIPKGWAMSNKQPHQVAEREAWEEAGIRGKAKKKAYGYYTYLKTLDTGAKVLSVVQVHLLEVSDVAVEFPERGQRGTMWLSPLDAALQIREPELRSLLTGAETALGKRPKKLARYYMKVP